MSTSISKGLLRAIAAAAFVATSGFAFHAQAGECPADKRMPNARQPVDFKAVGVTDTTLGSIDLGKEQSENCRPRAAIPQARHRTGRHSPVAQP